MQVIMDSCLSAPHSETFKMILCENGCSCAKTDDPVQKRIYLKQVTKQTQAVHYTSLIKNNQECSLAKNLCLN